MKRLFTSVLTAFFAVSLVGCVQSSTGVEEQDSKNSGPLVYPEPGSTAKISSKMLRSSSLVHGWMNWYLCEDECAGVPTTTPLPEAADAKLLSMLTTTSASMNALALERSDWDKEFGSDDSYQSAASSFPETSMSLWSTGDETYAGPVGLWNSSESMDLLAEAGLSKCETLLDPSREISVDDDTDIDAYNAFVIHKNELGTTIADGINLSHRMAGSTAVGRISIDDEQQLEDMKDSVEKAISTCSSLEPTFTVSGGGEPQASWALTSVHAWGDAQPGWKSIGYRYKGQISTFDGSPAILTSDDSSVSIDVFARLLVQGKNAFWIAGNDANDVETLEGALVKDFSQAKPGAVESMNSRPIETPKAKIESPQTKPDEEPSSTPAATNSSSPISTADSLYSNDADRQWIAWAQNQAKQASSELSTFKALACEDAGSEWSDDCLDALRAFPDQVGSLVSGVTESYELYGSPEAVEIDKLANSARSAAGYVLETSTRATDAGCLDENAPNMEIPRAKDGKKVPCRLFFSTKYWEDYLNAMQRIGNLAAVKP